MSSDELIGGVIILIGLALVGSCTVMEMDDRHGKLVLKCLEISKDVAGCSRL